MDTIKTPSITESESTLLMDRIKRNDRAGNFLKAALESKCCGTPFNKSLHSLGALDAQSVRLFFQILNCSSYSLNLVLKQLEKDSSPATTTTKAIFFRG